MKRNDRMYYGCEMDRNQMGLPKPLQNHPPGRFNKSEEHLIEQSKIILHRIISEKIRSLPEETRHIVPLSSGLDSRLILEMLHNYAPENNILAVSYGSPRTWDYELPVRIADAVGVSHRQIDLTDESVEWSLSSLLRHMTSVGTYHNVFEGYPNRYLMEKLADENTVFWSGYLGMLPGGSLPASRSQSWEEAKEYFADWCQCCESPVVSDNYDPTDVLPDEPWVKQESVNFDDQLNLGIRQQCYIRPIVIQDESRFITPFTDPAWMKFWMDVPWKYRKNSSLFKKLVREICTNTAEIRTDANYGAPLTWPRHIALARGASSLAWARLRAKFSGGLHHPDPHENYLNFAAAFRSDKRFKILARDTLVKLRDREIFDTDPLEIWETHQAGIDRSREIELLISSEIAARIFEDDRFD